MNYSDDQLRLALAKMLPEKIVELSGCFSWRNSEREKPSAFPIQDTEWLHVCWLIEQSLTKLEDQISYRDALTLGVGVNVLYWSYGTPQVYPATEYLKAVTASWQQRAIALAKVKGVEIV